MLINIPALTLLKVLVFLTTLSLFSSVMLTNLTVLYVGSSYRMFISTIIVKIEMNESKVHYDLIRKKVPGILG